MTSLTVFGRITHSDVNTLKELLTSFYDEHPLIACYESADDGCSRDHCHFIASTSNFKNLRVLRQSFSNACFKQLKEKNMYSLKEYDPEKKCLEYICKGHKKDQSLKPNIFCNTYDINVEEYYKNFHENQKIHKTTNNYKNTWTAIVNYIDKKEPNLLHSEPNVKTQYKICSYMYDYYVENEKMIMGKYQQQNILRTIISQCFKETAVKRTIIMDWCDDFHYYNSENQSQTVNHTLQNAFDNEELL